MPYNFVADSFYTKKLCSRLSSREVRFDIENDRFAFCALLWKLRSNVQFIHSFIFVLIEKVVRTQLNIRNTA